MTDVTVRTQCHPLANGRKARNGEHSWSLAFKLDDGRMLTVQMGKKAHDAFRSFVLREELDDAADDAQEDWHPAQDRMERLGS